MPQTPNSESVPLDGVITKIIYSSAENYFTVAKMKCDKDDSNVSIVGTLVGIQEGDQVRLQGMFQRHPKYGIQFNINRFEIILPTQINAIEKYLSSRAIKGIGPSLASSMIAKFGSQTLEILDKTPEKLLEIKGIGKKKLKTIQQSWSAQREDQHTMMFLAEHNIYGAKAVKICKHYGGNAVCVLKQHPYRLADEIDGIGFVTADRIAKMFGIPEDDPERIKAAIFYILHEATNQGHCFLPQEELVNLVANLLHIHPDKIQPVVEHLVTDKLCYRVDTESKPIYLRYLYAAEYYVASFLKSYLKIPLQRVCDNVDHIITQIESEMRLKFLESQKQAIYEALNHKICIITGGPGVGKTTIIKALVQILRRYGNVALAAPTGRAAKRLAETTNYTASTIHRLLRYNPHAHSFEYDEKKTLAVDHIIIDETSMVDINLAYYLLRAIPPSASITLVGDIDQLPSVGPGNFLKDIINSDLIPVVKLSYIFRQSKGSSIVEVAHQINRGIVPNIPTMEPSDILFIPMENPEEGSLRLVELASKILPTKHGLHPLTEIQVLTPMYRGDVGADRLNDLLAQALNPIGIAIGNAKFRTGDKVMQTVNNYDKEVYNGDIGVITSHNREEKKITVKYDNRVLVYEESELEELVRAYAISIHKSQGNEYPAVIIPLFTEHYIMLQRNLLYTAITRGKNYVIILGNYRALSIAVHTVKSSKRYTNLTSMLQS